MIDVSRYENDVKRFTQGTANAWRSAGLVRNNSYGATVHQLFDHQSPRVYTPVLAISDTLEAAEHDGAWYLANADGKAAISAETGMDSLVVVRLRPGLLADINNLFPYGGAVIDTVYGIIVAVSGFKEDEDIELAKAILQRLITLINREGEAQFKDTARRALLGNGADRFTRPA